MFGESYAYKVLLKSFKKEMSVLNSAITYNGSVVTAREYSKEVHGNRLFCIDSGCKVPVIHIPESENKAAYFKTTGKNDSKHATGCGFSKPLTFEESVKKVEEYQGELFEKGITEKVIRVNLNKLDPDYEPREVNKENAKKKKDPEEVKIKSENATPSSIGSLKSIVKLMTSHEPDILSSILVNVKGKKIPISSLIVDQKKAHNLLWSEKSFPYIGYFVYGKVESVLRRQKVIYINFSLKDNVPFSLVIFDKYFKHFNYTDSELEGKNILAWGILRKNTFQEKNNTEMAIKSDGYIEFLP